MKIAVCSDLHLEFGDINLKNADNADVLVLSGDICVAKELPYSDSRKGETFRNFFDRCAKEFPQVVYVMGNHEHYHGDFQTSTTIIQEAVKGFDNFHFLDKESVDIDGVTFIGGTLWTDMNKEDPLTMGGIRGMMNDFNIIENSKTLSYFRTQDGFEMNTRPAKFMPIDAVEDHKLMVELIKNTIAANPTGKYVVVGHHSPSKLSTKPQYEKDVIMNGGYSSDLSELILDHPQIKLWTHGHTHHKFDYVIGETRIVCNPRGYHMYEESADNFKLETYEI